MTEKPIRILHWGLMNGRGGIESFIMNLYRNIDRTKVQFDFLEDHNFGEFVYEQEIKELGGRVFRVLYSKRDDYKKSKKCLIDFLKGHPEIVGIHVHANFLYASLLKDAKKAGLQIRILHSHNSSAGETLSLRKKIRNLFVKGQISKYPTSYFACSDLAAKYMFPNKEYTWIKNGIDVDKFDYDEMIRKEIRHELQINDKDTVIGFVGNFREQKNPFFAVDILDKYCKKNKNVKMLFIGGGILEKRVKKYVDNKGLTANVRFLGLRKDVYKLYQAMDVFILPSLYEGLPVVLVEAQTSGLVCLVADNITRQIKVTNDIHYLPIDSGTYIWEQAIEKYTLKAERKGRKDEVIKAGFNMKDVAINIQDYYISKMIDNRRKND